MDVFVIGSLPQRIPCERYALPADTNDVMRNLKLMRVLQVVDKVLKEPGVSDQVLYHRAKVRWNYP